LPIIVVNNGGYGEIRDEMVRRGAEPLGVDLVAPDFVRVAEAFGARGIRLDNSDQLAPAVEQALDAAGPTIVEILQR
jgi:5-guanidino-2-oxopentanoate decarboxylase